MRCYTDIQGLNEAMPGESVALIEQDDTCKLGLLHPSLGLAFTDEFRPRDLGVTFVGKLRPLSFMDAFAPDKDADGLPDGCDGCRETITGDLQCCQEREP